VRNRVVAFVVALFLALAIAVVLGAQPVIPAGTRVRVWAPDTILGNPAASATGWRIGIVAASSPEHLSLRPDGERAAANLPWVALVRVESSLGATSRWRAGALIGGVITGAGFVSLACAMSSGSCAVSGDNAGGFVLYFLTGAIPGALVGAGIGSRFRDDERWDPLWTAPRATAPRATAPGTTAPRTTAPAAAEPARVP
jgi:hypothetical protein